MNNEELTHIDLFSGIGGFALAAETVWPGIRHTFCENDSFCIAVLKKHWPEAEYFGDIRTFTADTRSEEQRRLSSEWGKELAPTRKENIFILTGGFPCQPFSQAGRRKGTLDNDGDGDACNSGDGCGIIGVCNGDTTISVQDAASTPDGQQGEGTAIPVRQNIKRNGGQRISNAEGRATGNGRGKRSTRFTNDMEGNANVAEKRTSLSSPSTTGTGVETKNDGSTTVRRGNSSSNTDTRTNTNSSATTATTQRATSEHALINSQRVFLLTGGFPCQPFSQAGRRKGTQDDRFLWPEMARVIAEFRPQWVIAENVRGIVNIQDGVVFEQVCADLEGLGYEVQPIIIPAVAVNAPHRRDRVWFVAHESSPGLQGKNDEERNAGRSENNLDAQNPISKRGGTRRSECEGQRGRTTPIEPSKWNQNWPEVASALCDVAYGLPAGLVRPDGERDRNYPWWRKEALKAGGNSIVPQVAIEIMRAIAATNQ